MLALIIEGLAMLGEQSRLRELSPLVGTLLTTGAMVVWPIFRLTHTLAGMVASSANDWEAAKTHFETGLQQASSLPLYLEQAEIRRFHAMMLMDRAAPGDRERASELIAQAKEIYQRIGMSEHLRIARALMV